MPENSTDPANSPPKSPGNDLGPDCSPGASELKYRRLHESMTDAFVSVRMDGQITETNRAYQELVGYSAEELLELTYVDLTPAEWHEFESRIVEEQILRHGHSEVYQKQYRHKDGHTIPVELRTFLVRDDQGDPAAMWAIVRDITTRRRMQKELEESRAMLEQRVAERTGQLLESEERFRQLADASFEAIGVSHQGIVLDCNQRFVELFGWEHGEVVDRPVLDFVAPHFRAMVAERISAQYEHLYEIELLHRDGTIFPAEVRSRTVRSGDRHLRLSAIRDLRPSRLLEAKIERLRHDLNRAHDKTRLAEIGAAIAHQLGQPLTAISNNIAAFKMRIAECKARGGDALDVVSDIMPDVEGDVTRMSEIVHSLRLLAEPGPRPRETVAPDSIIKDVLQILMPGALSRDVLITTVLDSKLPETVADPVQLSQVFANIIQNAVDAASEGEAEQRQVRIHSSTDASGKIVVTVSDNGPGISPDHLPRIFDLFFTSKKSGTGIGLALCRRIINEYGGSITAHSANSSGARFEITLPAHKDIA